MPSPSPSIRPTPPSPGPSGADDATSPRAEHAGPTERATSAERAGHAGLAERAGLRSSARVVMRTTPASSSPLPSETPSPLVPTASSASASDSPSRSDSPSSSDSPSASPNPAPRRTIGWMYALSHAGLPGHVELAGVRYALERTVKHDFWAATGFYLPAETRPLAESQPLAERHLPADEAASNPQTVDAESPIGVGRIVVKINRRASLLGVPLRWSGRKLRRREVRAYAKLQDLPNVPRLLGDVTDTGFAHAYIEGHPLRRDVPVPDGFFDELLSVIAELHRRGLAYIDLNKPENILQSDDGRPCLIDFQISFDASAWWPRWLGRRLLTTCYRGDVYHVLKQKRRFRPADLTPGEQAILDARSWPIRLHRRLTRPYFWVRRPIMRWLTRMGWIEPETSK